MQEMAALIGNEGIASAKLSTLHDELFATVFLNRNHKEPNAPLFVTLPQ